MSQKIISIRKQMPTLNSLTKSCAGGHTMGRGGFADPFSSTFFKTKIFHFTEIFLRIYFLVLLHVQPFFQ